MQDDDYRRDITAQQMEESIRQLQKRSANPMIVLKTIGFADSIL